MDFLGLIHNIFSRMTCPHCHEKSLPKAIRLIRQEQGVYLVTVQCEHCDTEVGLAMIGLESQMEADLDERPFKEYDDPELTEAELERLSSYNTIAENDVLEAHEFFQNLGADWQRFIPPTLREADTVLESEAPDA